SAVVVKESSEQVTVEDCKSYEPISEIGGMRRANKWSARGTIALTLTLFFRVPMNAAKFQPSLTSNPQYLATNEFVVVRETRAVSPTDVERRDAAIQVWNERRAQLESSLAPELSDAERAAAVHAELGPAPKKIALGETIVDEFRTGGKAIFWGGGSRRSTKTAPSWSSTRKVASSLKLSTVKRLTSPPTLRRSNFSTRISLKRKTSALPASARPTASNRSTTWRRSALA
ncbi:MAG: hypothetical protein IJN32_04705, partial [Thermoguttaceae bacterium]|nr:hypothetical protein [Thermoguttaceae bacterium]